MMASSASLSALSVCRPMSEEGWGSAERFIRARARWLEEEEEDARPAFTRASTRGHCTSPLPRRKTEEEMEWHRIVEVMQERRSREREEERAEAERWRRAQAEFEVEEQRRLQAKRARDEDAQRQAALDAARKQREACEAEEVRRWLREEKQRVKQEKERRRLQFGHRSGPMHNNKGDTDQARPFCGSASVPSPPPKNQPSPEEPQASPPPPPSSTPSSAPPPPHAAAGRGPQMQSNPRPEPGPGFSSQMPTSQKRSRAWRFVSFFQRIRSSTEAGEGGRPPLKMPRSTRDHAEESRRLIANMEHRLGESRAAPWQVRKRLFRDLQRELHPDKNLDDPEAAKLAFQRLMELRGSFLAP